MIYYKILMFRNIKSTTNVFFPDNIIKTVTKKFFISLISVMRILAYSNIFTIS